MLLNSFFQLQFLIVNTISFCLKKDGLGEVTESNRPCSIYQFKHISMNLKNRRNLKRLVLSEEIHFKKIRGRKKVNRSS